MKIGLTYTGGEEKHNNYAQWLKGNEAIEVVALSSALNNAEELNNCDTLVLSGGVDIHPEFFKGATTYSNQPEEWDLQRDLFEKQLYQSAITNNQPVLGICRGFQLINVLNGGTLNQDLADLNATHNKEGIQDKLHEVSINRNSLLFEITGTTNDKVNSAHHQSINQLGNGLAVNCIAEDGIIEGIEWADKTDKPFLLGVQWHPERMNKYQLSGSPLSKNIRDYFINEIKKTTIKQ